MNARKLAAVLVLMAACWVGYRHWGGGQADWEIHQPTNHTGVIVAFGDSLTTGFGASKGRGYPDLLAADFPAYEFKNHGRNGDTTISAWSRINDVVKEKPEMVLITLGGNDLMQQVSLAETVDHLGKIFSRLRKAGAMVVYLSIDPPFVGDNWSMALRQTAKEHGVLWVDQVMDGLWGNKALMSDRVHPNAEGYKTIAKRVATALKPFLKK